MIYNFDYVGVVNITGNNHIAYVSSDETRAKHALCPWPAESAEQYGCTDERHHIPTATKERDALVDILCQCLDQTGKAPRYVQLVECTTPGVVPAPDSVKAANYWITEKDGSVSWKRVSHDELVGLLGISKGGIDDLMKSLEAFCGPSQNET
jgi:hypothetical protein